jgi:hypothetical protein
MKRINDLFKCPRCFNHRLEEVQINVTVATVVDMLGAGGDTQYGQQTNEDGTTERFQCIDCGWIVPDATTTEELYELLTSPESPCKT